MRTRKADGDALRELREDKWWTQAQLSKASGVNRSTIVEIEGGKNPHPRTGTILALAKALEVDPNALLEERRNGSNPLGEARARLHRYAEGSGNGGQLTLRAC